MSYVTGTHAVKFGFNNTQGALRDRTYDFQPVSYRFNQRRPESDHACMPRPTSTRRKSDADLGFYVQDRWTLGRLTLMGGIRYDYFKTHFPEITLGPGTATARLATSRSPPPTTWHGRTSRRAGRVLRLSR